MFYFSSFERFTRLSEVPFSRPRGGLEHLFCELLHSKCKHEW